METPLTVRELIAVLEQAHPDSHIFVQGCDCINQATKVWGGRRASHEDYQGQLMLGFGPRNSYTSSGWREIYPDPESRARRPSVDDLEKALGALQHSLAAPDPDQPRTWHPRAARRLRQAQSRIKAALAEAPEPAGPEISRPPGALAQSLPPELTAALEKVEQLRELLRTRFQEILSQDGELPESQPATDPEQELLDAVMAPLQAVRRQWLEMK